PRLPALPDQSARHRPPAVCHFLKNRPSLAYRFRKVGIMLVPTPCGDDHEIAADYFIPGTGGSNACSTGVPVGEYFWRPRLEQRERKQTCHIQAAGACRG